MGLNSATFEKFEKFYDEGIFQNVSHVMELGSQELLCHGTEDKVKHFLNHLGINSLSDEEIVTLARGGSAKQVYEMMGFTYNCIDVDGQFDALVIDMNFEDVPESHRNIYDFVTNFGTTEHVANQLNCFKVMHDLTKPGGYMYHELICSGMLNHGLVNYNPKFFWALCQANFYDYVGMWITSETHKPPEKLPENIVNLCRDLDPEVLEYFETKNAGLQVLVRKAYDLPFVPPFDLLTEELPSAMTETQKLRYETLVSYPWPAYNKIKNLKYRIITPTVEKLNETQEHLDKTTAQLHQTIVQFQESQTELHKTQAKLQQIEPELQQLQTQFQQSQQQLHQLKDKLEQTKSKLHQSDEELQQKEVALQKSQTNLQQSRLEVEQIEAELYEAKAEIMAMKTSKFWKLRSQWFKLKKLLGLPE